MRTPSRLRDFVRVGRGRVTIEEIRDQPKTLVDHLNDLRSALRISFIAWLMCSVIAFIFSRLVLSIMLHPLHTTLQYAHAEFQTPVFTSPTEGLSITFQVVAVVGLILSMPVTLWQMWKFIAPGLRGNERKLVFPIFTTSLVLFAIGTTFAYFVMPIGLGFMISFMGGTAQYLPDISSYITFFLILALIFGVMFELPVVVIALGAAGIVSSAWLSSHRWSIWLGIVSASLILTPGTDPYTPTALALPLLGLFEGSRLFTKRVLHK